MRAPEALVACVRLVVVRGCMFTLRHTATPAIIVGWVLTMSRAAVQVPKVEKKEHSRQIAIS